MLSMDVNCFSQTFPQLSAHISKSILIFQKEGGQVRKPRDPWGWKSQTTHHQHLKAASKHRGSPKSSRKKPQGISWGVSTSRIQRYAAANNECWGLKPSPLSWSRGASLLVGFTAWNILLETDGYTSSSKTEQNCSLLKYRPRSKNWSSSAQLPCSHPTLQH